jgi:protein-S-isoprenylcysteine O-methyltransferase Ste14
MMKIPGFEGFKAHLPESTETQALQLVLRLPKITLLCSGIGIILDIAIRYVNHRVASPFLWVIEPWVPFFISLILIFGGSQIAQSGFKQRDRLVQLYGDRAYQHAVKPILTGIPMVFAGLLYGYFPHGLPSILNYPIMQTANPASEVFSTSMLTLLWSIEWDEAFRTVCGILFLFLGVLTAVRSVQQFGIDNAALVYVYYPEDSKVVNHAIYSIVRHPMYMAVVMLGVGAFLFRFSVYGFAHMLIVLGSFYYHIIGVEEKELVKRFGDSYLVYRKEVPAILIRPRNWGLYLKFVLDLSTKKKGSKNVFRSSSEIS